MIERSAGVLRSREFRWIRVIVGWGDMVEFTSPVASLVHRPFFLAQSYFEVRSERIGGPVGDCAACADRRSDKLVQLLT